MSVRTNAGFLDSVPVGAGMDWFTNTAPENWMLCQGQAISRTDYAELFAIIGTTYGAGNGTTTFNLPDFSGRTGVGKSASGRFANLGTKTGEEEVTLNANQIPPHQHSYTKTDCTYKAEYDRTYTGVAVDSFSQVAQLTGSLGGGQPHNNVQPSLVQNKIIKVK